MRSPQVGVLVSVTCLGVHGVARALLPHSPTHTHTVRQTTVGVGTWVAVGHREWPEYQCTMGLAVMVIVWTCCNVPVEVGVEEGSNDLAVVLRLLGSRSPSEWSVGLGFHLNGPLCLGFHLNVPLSRWTGRGVGGVGGVLEAPTIGSIGFRFSRVPPPTFSAAHTDLEILREPRT